MIRYIINAANIHALSRPQTPGVQYTSLVDFNAKQLIGAGGQNPIFGYQMQEDGFVVIKKLWLQKVWEICRRMENWPLNLQIKDKVVHKIRPAVQTIYWN